MPAGIDTATAMTAGLEAFIAAAEGQPVTVADLAPISSVGNARDPWGFTARWADGREARCVMLVKAEAGQLETELGPEFHTLARLEGSGVPAPPALWLDEAGQAFGRAFFVTGWVPGTAETRSLRQPEHHEANRVVAHELAAAAARLHRVDVGPFIHLPAATPATAAADQLALWRAQFERHRLEPHPGLVYCFEWLAARAPVAERVSVVHGDLRFGNLLAHEGHLTALLDWEMVHLGDPIEDLGWVYREVWTPAAACPFEEFLAAYAEAGGVPYTAEHLRWWRIFGEVKHSVISLTATRSFAVDGASVRHANRSATVPGFLQAALALVAEAELGAAGATRPGAQGAHDPC